MVDWNTYNMQVTEPFFCAEDALDYIRTDPVDAVITDIRMSEMCGVELASILNAEFPEIKIVFLTAYCGFDYAVSAIKYDVVAYISKPILPEPLEESLLKLQRKLEQQKPRKKDTERFEYCKFC